MSTNTRSTSWASDLRQERRGEVVQIGALIPAVLERYELRFPSPNAARVSTADTVSSDETTSNPPADGLRCV